MIWKWCARVAWIVLPVTAGTEVSHALEGWSHPTAIVAMVLLWGAWLGGAIALFAPRPWGFAVLRVVAPAALMVAVFAHTSAATRAVGIVSALIAMVLVLGAPIARASANSISYGDEDRYPLAIPLTIALVPLPVAVLFIIVGVSLGPLWLAGGRVVAGIVAVLLGVPIALAAANSVRALSRRWLVFVPAGIVVVDPLTLADPMLMPREDIAEVTTKAVPGGLDLRLGAARGSLTINLRDHAMLTRRRGRADAVVLHARAIRVAIVDRRGAFAVAAGRRIPVTTGRVVVANGQTAMPPPSTTSAPSTSPEAS